MYWWELSIKLLLWFIRCSVKLEKTLKDTFIQMGVTYWKKLAWPINIKTNQLFPMSIVDLAPLEIFYKSPPTQKCILGNISKSGRHLWTAGRGLMITSIDLARQILSNKPHPDNYGDYAHLVTLCYLLLNFGTNKNNAYDWTSVSIIKLFLIQLYLRFPGVHPSEGIINLSLISSLSSLKIKEVFISSLIH